MTPNFVLNLAAPEFKRRTILEDPNPPEYDV